MKIQTHYILTITKKRNFDRIVTLDLSEICLFCCYFVTKILKLKFYTYIGYDIKNMCKFSKKINFINLFTRKTEMSCAQPESLPLDSYPTGRHGLIASSLSIRLSPVHL
jgi:hypothetical protein